MVDGSQGVFVFPKAFYDRTRPVLFATDYTRVYGPAISGDQCAVQAGRLAYWHVTISVHPGSAVPMSLRTLV